MWCTVRTNVLILYEETDGPSRIPYCLGCMCQADKEKCNTPLDSIY
jgi:hypothetical protein